MIPFFLRELTLLFKKQKQRKLFKSLEEKRNSYDYFFLIWCPGVCGNANGVYSMDVVDRRPTQSYNFGIVHVHMQRNSWLSYTAASARGERNYLFFQYFVSFIGFVYIYMFVLF